MVGKQLTGLASLYQNAWAKLAVVMATIATLGFLTVGHYGVSWDEPYGVSSVWWNLNLLKNKEPIPGIFQYDGTVFNFAAEAAFQVQQRLEQGVAPRSTPEVEQPAAETRLAKARFLSKHAFTFLTTLPAYLLVAFIVGVFCGAQSAWLGPVTLALFPRFWGHSFFNFKDIPFATLFTLCTVVGAVLVADWLQGEGRAKLGLNRLTLTSVLYGVLVGLLTGLRAGGLVVLVFPLLAYLILRLSLGPRYLLRDLLTILYSPILILLSGFATATLCYPSSWSNPIVWFFKALKALSQYEWNSKILFQGQFYEPGTLPWYYIPTWVWMVVPVVFQLAFVAGLVLLLKRFKGLSNFQQSCLVLLLLQIFLLPTLVVVRRSIIYGEIRHFLFIIPAIAAIAGIGLLGIYTVLPKRSFQLFAFGLMAVLLMGIGSDMVALHPYQYLYFNRASGGLSKANQHFETDYWGLSLREGMEWINQNGDRKFAVLIGGPTDSAAVFADPAFKLWPFVERKPPAGLSKPFYYLSLYAGNRQFQTYYPECPVVYQVMRQDTPLSIVKQCG